MKQWQLKLANRIPIQIIDDRTVKIINSRKFYGKYHDSIITREDTGILPQSLGRYKEQIYDKENNYVETDLYNKEDLCDFRNLVLFLNDDWYEEVKSHKTLEYIIKPSYVMHKINKEICFLIEIVKNTKERIEELF